MIDCKIVRELALALPEVEEHDHWGRPSFRVKGKIFATLWPDEQRVMLKLAPPDQMALTILHPATFSAVPGTWGERGSTYVQLQTVEQADFQSALKAAWRGVAPKRLLSAEV